MKQTFVAIGMALLLASCSDNKPFKEYASIKQEASDKYAKICESEVRRDSESFWEFNERFNEKVEKEMEPYKQKLQKIYESLDGVEIKTEATEETGFTIEKGFTIDIDDDDDDKQIELKAKVKGYEYEKFINTAAIGYDGDTPVLFLAGCKKARYSLHFDEEEGTISFHLGVCSPEALGRIDKIVLTTDLDLAYSLEHMIG